MERPFSAREAEQFAVEMRPWIECLRAEGHTSFNAMAARLNQLNVRTVRGCRWQAKQVWRVIKRQEAASLIAVSFPTDSSSSGGAVLEPSRTPLRGGSILPTMAHPQQTRLRRSS
jgi:hypothetical protein